MLNFKWYYHISIQEVTLMKRSSETRRLAIEKAKEAQKNGGVGIKTAGLTNKHDPIVSASNRTNRILRSI